MHGIGRGTGWLTAALALLFWLTAPLTSVQAQLTSYLPPPEVITDRQGLPQAFVPAIVQDQQGFIWMATLDGLARYDGRSFKVFQPSPDGRPGLSSAGIEDLLTDPRGNLWVKTYQNDLDWFDTRRETVVNFSRQPRYQQYVGRDTLESCYPDRRHRLWVWLRNQGLLCFDLTTPQVRRYRHQARQAGSLASNTVLAVTDDGAGHIWVATSGGLDRLDERTNAFIHYRPRPGDSTAIPEVPVRTLHRRQNGDLLLVSDHYLTLLDHRNGRIQHTSLATPTAQWGKRHLGTDSQGNDYLDRARQILRVRRPAAGPALVLTSLLPAASGWRSMGLFVDRSDVLWVGTDATGIRKFNLRTTLFASQPYRHSFQVDLLTNGLGVPPDQVAQLTIGRNPYNLRTTIDRTGHLWFSWGNTPLYRLNRQTKQVAAIPFPVPINEAGSDRPIVLATDPGGRVWALHDSLVYWYNGAGGSWQRFPYPIRRYAQAARPLPAAQPPSRAPATRPSGPGYVRRTTLAEAVESPILQLVVDNQFLWLMTAARGLYQVDRQTGQIRHHAHQPTDSTSLSSNNLYCLFADPIDPNTLWVGTVGTGVCRFDKRSGRSQRYSTQNGLPNNVIYAAIPDRRGYVWIATNQGLCRLDRRTGRTRTYTREDGLSADEFNRFHSLYLPGQTPATDRILLGGIEGITSFAPGQVREDAYQPRVELTGIWLNNRRINPGPHSPLGTEPVQMAQHLTLPPDQNFLTIDFAALQFNNPGRLSYRYRLDGIDRDWTLTQSPQAIYTNLSPGTYTLSLNAANTSGLWSGHIRTLRITIRPPWWASWWAYTLYVGMAGGLAVVGARSWLRRREETHQRAVARLKEQFFANITHEFRTPLTLILSPVESLLGELQQTPYAERLTLVDRNARQLLSLVNQLMDLAKLDARLMPVTPVWGRPDDVVNNIVQSFGEAARAGFIQLHFQTEVTRLYRFDADKLERIVANLVANALKFTPGTATAPGTVTVTLTPAANGVQLCVRDSGIGITAGQISHLFERFYQVEQPGVRPSGGQQPGSGIGLALVRELVELQGGQIRVDSQPGAGTTFRVDLPYRPAADGMPAPASVAPASLPRPLADVSPESTLLLLVEDNDDIARFISGSLPPHYTVHRAVDGQEGLEQARQLLPDVIISDVMMPRMDGYALCQHLKTDALTDHIPVLLLTAKVALESRMQGLSLGADDYLGKPFHLPELLLRLANLLATQRRQRERIRTQLASPATVTLATLPADATTPTNLFLEKLHRLLDQHLDEAAFGVEELADGANLSRMQLHRKIKSLTNLSTTEFIRTYRLQQAIPLLRQGMPVAQTAYAVGFNNPSYFSQSFRDLFGQSPSSYSPEAAV